MHDATRTPHVVGSGTVFPDPLPCPRYLATEPVFDVGASRISLAPIGSSRISRRGLPSGSQSPQVRFPKDTRPATVSRFYPLYFISIDCLLSSKVYQCLPSRQRSYRPTKTNQLWGRSPCELCKVMQNEWPVCSGHQTTTELLTKITRWSLHAPLYAPWTDQTICKWPSNRVSPCIVHPDCPKNAKSTTLRRLAGRYALRWIQFP